MSSDISFTVEYMVEMSCNACVKKVETIVSNSPMVLNYSINLEKQQVVIETNEPVMKITSLLEDSNKSVVLRGITTSSTEMKSQDYGSGVCIFQDPINVFGVCRIYQITDNMCYFNGFVDQLENNTQYKLYIHELGDVSNGPYSCGEIFNGHSENSTEASGHVVDLISDGNGQCKIDTISDTLRLWDLIGRSLVIHAVNGKARIMCGIIARSSGAFQNTKMVCACDGTTVWEERERSSLK